jgi:hypothetical protein
MPTSVAQRPGEMGAREKVVKDDLQHIKPPCIATCWIRGCRRAARGWLDLLAVYDTSVMRPLPQRPSPRAKWRTRRAGAGHREPHRPIRACR